MNIIDKVLYYFSHTDIEVIDSCTQHAKSTRKLWGKMTITVAMFSFLGVYHLVVSMFKSYGADGIIPISTTETVISLVVALSTTLLITLFNINTLGTSSKLLIFPRLFLSLASSILISLAIILSLSESNITQEIHESVDKKISTLKENEYSHANFLKDEIKSYREAIKIVRADLRDATKAMNNSAQLATNERIGKGINNSIAKCGYKCMAFESDEEEYRRQKDNLEQKLKHLVRELDANEREYSDEIKQLNTRLNEGSTLIKSTQSVDFFTQSTVLIKLISENVLLLMISALFAIVLLFFDLYPSFLKLFSEATDYDEKIMARKLINAQIIRAITNENLQKIEAMDIDQRIMTDIHNGVQK